MRRPFAFLKVLMMFIMAVMLCSPLGAATADEYYQAGLSLYSQRNYPQAIPYLKAAVQLNPNHWQAYQLMGYCYYQTQDNINALDALDKSIAANPENLELKIFADNLRTRTGIVPGASAAAAPGAALVPAAQATPAPAFGKMKWIKLNAGGMFASLGDLKGSADAINTIFADYPHKVSTDGMGLLVGLEGGYGFNPENAIAFSVSGGLFGGYSAEVDLGGHIYANQYTPTMVEGCLKYCHFFPMGSSRIRLGIGPAMYFTMLQILQTVDGTTTGSGNMAGSGFGGALDIGWEMALSEQFSFNVYLRGRYASTNNIKSDAQTTTGQSLGEIGLAVNQENVVGIALVSDIGKEGIRWANVDYTGADGGLGLTFHY